MSLKSDYINACNAYLKAFCEMYGFDYYPDFWIGDEVGGVIELGDYFVNINTIRTAVDRNVPREEFVKWYDSVWTAELSIYIPQTSIAG